MHEWVKEYYLSNTKQLTIKGVVINNISYITPLNWCKKPVLALKENKPDEPYHVFLGPGGAGKSHVVKLIHSDTLKLLKLYGTFEPDDVIGMLTAPTGGVRGTAYNECMSGFRNVICATLSNLQ